jgi:hypothetical protein
MLLSPCRFKVPLTDNAGQPIEARAILELHRELMAAFQGFTIHPTSQGRWQSRAGRVYQEEVVVYEAAVAQEKVTVLRDLVRRLGRSLGQLAMFFDAPTPSVETIDLSDPPSAVKPKGGSGHEPRSDKATRRGSKKNRRPS